MSSAVIAPSAERYLARLRARAAVALGMRAAVAAAGSGAAVLALGAYALGPLAAPEAVVAVWALALGAMGAAAVTLLGPLRSLRGSGAARLVAERSPELVSPLRSAFELRAVPAGASADLVEAHARAVRARIAELPVGTVVGPRWLRHRSVGLGLLALALALATVVGFERAGAGAFALLHPGARDDEGAPITAAFAELRARIIYPTYLDRPAAEIESPSRLDVPLGATIELSARALLRAREAELHGPDGAIRMESDGARWQARLLVRTDGVLALRLRTADGEWVRDGAALSIHVEPDATPVVALLAPLEDRTVEAAESVAVAYLAEDDVGVVQVELVIRGADGREHRRRLSAPERPTTALPGDDVIEIAELGAHPGDRLEIWIEARDGDDVGGPHVGRSETRSLTLASDASHRQENLEELADLLDRTLGVLADRLESPPPDAPAAVISRFAVIRADTEGLITAFDGFARGRTGAVRPADAGLYAGTAGRLRLLLLEEMRLSSAPPLGPPAARQGVDARAVTELENDALLVADLVRRARIDDAAAIARELEELRREISSLIEELRRADTPEARAALLAAISRATQRLSDLRARMSAVESSIPQEFANAGEEQLRRSEDALASMREAIERGDLEGASQALTRLEQQIDALARALGATGEAFGEERFGPRERALAEALDRLEGLEAEERELARRTAEVRGAAARRALGEADARSAESARRLAAPLRAAREALGEVGGPRLSSLERETFDSISQRLRDVEDALATGDLGEASRAAQTAEEQMEELRRDIDLDAMMLGSSEAARRGRTAERRIGELRDEIERMLPTLQDHLDAAGRAQLAEDAERQRRAQAAAGEIAGLFDEGPEGTPLAPRIGDGLRQVAGMMEEAVRELSAPDPARAARAQDEAARRLAELRQELESEAEQSAGGSDGASGSELDRSRVRIHQADEFEGPMELRRRLLDAMHEASPRGYEESVQRYYEGLLR